MRDSTNELKDSGAFSSEFGHCFQYVTKFSEMVRVSAKGRPMALKGGAMSQRYGNLRLEHHPEVFSLTLRPDGAALHEGYTFKDLISYSIFLNTVIYLSP